MWALYLALGCGLVSAAEQSFSLSTFRSTADPHTRNALSLTRRQSGQIPTVIDHDLYWFGNFSVGDGKDLTLLIDTGSLPLVLNPGQYKPSVHSKPVPNSNFSFTYEGVGRNGYGFETINGTVFKDVVSAAGLTVVDQPIGNVTAFQFFEIPHAASQKKAYQHDGIIGFTTDVKGTNRKGSHSWFYNLCKTNAVTTCQFGLAFGTSGKGQLALGKVATDLIKGDLTVVKQTSTSFFTVKGDITLDNKIVATNQTIVMDVGTNNIQASLDVTKTIFKKLGIKPIIQKTAGTSGTPGATQVTGYFACDKPPTLGFSFPAQSELKKGQKARIFNVSPAVWGVDNHGHNNCTSILGGTSFLGKKSFFESQAVLLGQSFFEGHYINFNENDGAIGFGDLKDPTMASST